MEIIAERNTTFKIVEPYRSNYCKVNINIIHKKNKRLNYSVYDISYEYYYSHNDSVKLNPFFKDMDNKNGEIIRMNDLSVQLVKFLLMDEKHLSKYSGYTTPVQYKINIMRMISHLWE